MERFKKSLILFIILVTYTPSVVANALTTVTGYKSINNYSDSSYKTSENDIRDLIDNMNRPSDFKEILNYSDSKKVIDSNKELSYLVDKNILGSDIDVIYDRSKISSIIKTSESKRFDYDTNNNVSKSDFLATLSKAVFGVEESRYLVFQGNATRDINGKEKSLYVSSEYVPKGYQGDDTSFDFSKGDYHLFVTPNVYELYYKTLINKGIVSTSEFSDVSFINQMKSYGSISNNKVNLSLWDPSLGYYNVSSSNYNYGVNILDSNILGSGFELKESSNGAELKLVPHSWFLDEKLITIDALRYIEKALRSSEKDMTKTEAELVNYKYGAMYLDRLDESSKDTIMFLVAKGILNFENEEEFNNIYKDFTGSFFRTLIYRIYNKDARLNFSSIQLTDSDNFWLSRGYYSNKIELYKGLAPSFDTEVKEVTQSKSTRNLFNLFGLIKTRDITITDGPLEYEVKRTFNNKLIYTYKGITLSSSTKPEGDIVSAQTSADNDHLIVTFKVKAVNPTAAIAVIDANMSVENSDSISIGTIPAVSEVKGNKVSSTYVSQSALRNLSGSPILISNDKYLINKENNAKALLLEDNNICIIGNEIIKTDGNFISGINGEVYYNFAIISKLLSQSMVSSLDPNSLYVSSNSSSETKYKFLSQNGSELENIYVNTFKDKSISTGSSKLTDKLFYNITLSNSTSNYLIQNISKDLGQSASFFNYMVVEFKYVVPSSSDLPINYEYLNKVLSQDLSMSDVYSKFYEKPNNEVMSSIWDSNLMMSNTLVNYMMGTSGVSYIRSGYIVPKVYILTDKRTPEESYSVEEIDNLFIDKIKMSTSLVNTYGSYNTDKKFVENYFTYVGASSVSTDDKVFDTIKRERTLEVLPYRKSTDGKIGYFDFNKFKVLNTGQVFRSIDDCKDLKYDKSKKTITYELKTGTVPTIKPWVNYTVDGNNSSITNLLSTKVSAYGIADLVSIDPIEFYYKSDRDSNDKLVYKDGSGNLISVQDHLSDIGKSIFGDSGFLGVTYLNCSGDLNVVNNLKNDSIYYSEGKFIQVDSDGKKKDLSEKSDSKILDGARVYVYPKFQISNSLFTPNVNNVLTKDKYNPILDMGNVVNGGIASQIVDSIVYSNLDYVSYNELPKGAKVYIGDSMYTKSGEFLQSGVLDSSDLVESMLQTDLLDDSSSDKIKSIVSRTIGNFNLFNRSANTSSKYGGPEVPLADYITYAKFGSGFEGSKYSKTLMLDSKGKLVVRRFMGSDGYQFGTPFDSYCIAFSLDNSVRFRAIDDTNTEFTIIRVINKNSDGFLEDVPYFIETLDYSEMDGLNFDIIKALFKPSENAGDLMKKFLDAYKLNTQRDLKELAKYWIRLICTVLSVCNLLALVFRRSPLDVLVRDIKYSHSSKYNVDLYKIFTFGFQSVDIEMPIWKGVLVSGVLVAIASFATIGPF